MQTPNLSAEPRESESAPLSLASHCPTQASRVAVVVIGFSRSWLRRPEVGLRIRQSDWDRLDEEGQSLLRFEQVVPDSEFGPTRGEGWSPTYDSAALEKASGASYRQHDDV